MEKATAEKQAISLGFALGGMVFVAVVYSYTIGTKVKAPVDTTPSGDSTVEDTDTPTGPTE